MSTEQSDQLARIRQRIVKAAADNGCHEMGTFIQPASEPGHSTQAHIYILLDEDAPETVVEDAETKDAFDSIVGDAAKAEQEAKAEQSKSDLEEMRDRLKDDPKGGFL